MKLSKKFLSDYLDIGDMNTKDIAEKMTLAGNEYDSIETIAEGTNLVVGYVTDCKDHPDSDHLHVCQVEIKPGEFTQIVCGAPNVGKGQKVIVSLPGAVLPGDFEIKKSVIRGQESNGMICALGEIGIDSKYQSEEDKAGIHVLSNDAPVGEDALKYLEFDDEIIDFELTANRGDLLSVLGMAYEVGAIFNKKVDIRDEKINNEIEDISNYVSVNVLTDNCPLYLARMVKDVEIKDSPQFIKARLMASGIRPINNVVDISNYVMLEYGQPLHFFDYKTLGNKIIVRMAEEKEHITTLDNIERELGASDIVIANEKEPVALAGVMGGLNSDVEADTKDIVIESAIFDSILVRMTSKSVLRSEASNRFEKGLDPKRTYMAIDRACYLLEKYANAKVVKGIIKHDNINYEDKIIEITKEKITTILGIDLTSNQILDILNRLSFDVKEKDETFIINVPSRRLDINIGEDLIEEVGRIHGMDAIKGTLPKETIKPGKYNSIYAKEKSIKKRLESLGLNEVINFSLTNEKDVKRFTADEFEPYVIANPMTEDRKYMRYSLIPSLINVADYNLSRKNNDILIYELSKIYYKKNDEDIMGTRLTGLMHGTYLNNLWQHEIIKVDFYLVKGIIENLLNFLGLSPRYSFDNNDIPKDFHPYQTARILVDNKPIGFVGLINPTINKNKLYLFELNLDIINDAKVRKIKNKEVSRYPAVVKDAAFVMDKSITAEEILNTIRRAGGRILSTAELFDYYVGENIDSSKKSLAFTLTFTDLTKTLSDEEVMQLFNNIVSEVSKKHNAILRDK